MQVNLKDFLNESGITEEFYPGKRLVKQCVQAGQYKGHCVIFDWRAPDTIRIEVKAGLTGRSLDKNDLKYYPVSFQAPTYVNIEIVNDNEILDEDEDAEGSKGKGGGGGKKPKRKLSDLKSLMTDAFEGVMEGKIPELGDVKDIVIMGKEVAAEAFGRVLESFAEQIANAKISATQLMAKAADIVTKYEPPSFMKPAGDETAKYSYNREKNANIAYSNTFN